MFVYGIDFYITMSGIELSQLERCISILSYYWLLLKCNDVIKHDGLLPFFYDNRTLGYIYDSILTNDNEEVKGKDEIEQYKAELSGVCSSGPYTNSFDLEENEWTVRLYHSSFSR